MPYVINVPGCPRPYITNDPRIFFDAKAWGWPVESRPYSDSFCKAMRREEGARFESERRTAQLERCWTLELMQRQTKPTRVRKTKNIATSKKHAKHAKHDSVHDMVVVEAVDELELDADNLHI
jgi:hypothetical protein